MKAKFITNLIFTVIIMTFFSFDFDKAEGWFIAGSKPKSYEMGIDKGAGPNAKNVASIKSIVFTNPPRAVLMNTTPFFIFSKTAL